MIFKTFEVGPYQTNCYIVGSDTSKNAMVIDPGDQANLIISFIKKHDLKVSLIVITHSHFDHTGALKEVKEATGARVAIHEAEADGAKGIIAGLMAGIQKAVKPDLVFKDGDTIDIDDLHFKVLHTPGHSPGGISLYGHGLVFTGDALFNMGIGRTDFPGCSHARLIESIKSKLLSLPDDTLVYPGHGPESSIGYEKQRNPFLNGTF